jgi:hypothetical protein
MALLEWLDAQFCARLTLTLLHFVWQGLSIAMLAALAASSFRRSSPRIRYSVYGVSLLFMVACPLVTFWLLDVADTTVAAVEPARPAGVSEAETVVHHSAPVWQPGDGTFKLGATSARPTVGTPARPDGEAVAMPWLVWVSGFDWQPLTPFIAGFHALGVLAMLSRLLAGLFGGNRLRRASSRLEDADLMATIGKLAKSLGLWFTPGIAVCRQIVLPTVVGVIRPTILLSLSMVGGLNGSTCFPSACIQSTDWRSLPMVASFMWADAYGRARIARGPRSFVLGIWPAGRSLAKWSSLIMASRAST